MRTPRDPIYAGHRYPAEIISYAVWLDFRIPMSLRMVEEMLAARGISVTHETIRQWGLKFGRELANRIRRRAPRRGDKWHLDGVSRTHLRRMKVWSCTRDEGGPLDAGGQAQASNHCKLPSSKALVVLCQEGARAPCCTRDEGGPFGAVL